MTFSEAKILARPVTHMRIGGDADVMGNHRRHNTGGKAASRCGGGKVSGTLSKLQHGREGEVREAVHGGEDEEGGTEVRCCWPTFPGTERGAGL